MPVGQKLWCFFNYSANPKYSRKRYCDIYNVTDASPYTFDEIIGVFKQSSYQPRKIVLPVPMVGVRLLLWLLSKTKMRSPEQVEWLNAAYNKLALDLVFDNQKMIATGFMHLDDLPSVYGVNADVSC